MDVTSDGPFTFVIPSTWSMVLRNEAIRTEWILPSALASTTFWPRRQPPSFFLVLRPAPLETLSQARSRLYSRNLGGLQPRGCTLGRRGSHRHAAKLRGARLVPPGCTDTCREIPLDFSPADAPEVPFVITRASIDPIPVSPVRKRSQRFAPLSALCEQHLELDRESAFQKRRARIKCRSAFLQGRKCWRL